MMNGGALLRIRWYGNARFNFELKPEGLVGSEKTLCFSLDVTVYLEHEKSSKELA